MEFTPAQKLDNPDEKINVGQKALSYAGPSLWNNFNKTLKTSNSLNDFKHNIKQHYLSPFLPYVSF